MAFGVIFKTYRPNQVAYLGFFYAFVIGVSALVGIPAIFDADAYYYFTVARNIASGAGSTYDGVTVTTGYHPLWLGITTVVHYIFTDVASFHYAIHALLTGLFIAGHYLLMRVAIILGINFRAFMLASLLILVLNFAVFQSGLENTLLFFFLSLFLWQQFHEWRSNRASVVANSLVLLLAYFARLDVIFLVALYLPWHLWKYWLSGQRVAAITLPAIVLAGIMAHWLFMLANFDTIFSTSQMSLEEVQHLGANALFSFSAVGHSVTILLERVFEVLGYDPVSSTRFLGLVAPVILILSLIFLARKEFRWRFPIIMLGLMAAIQHTYFALVLNVWTREWYFTGWFIVVLFGAAFVLSKVTGRLHIIPMGLIFALVVIGILFINMERKNDSWSRALAQSEILQEFDKPGNILVGRQPDRAAYFSGVPVYHLEGKMNGYEFVRSYLLPKRLGSYLRDIGATHFVYSNAVNPPGLPAGGLRPGYVPCQVPIAEDEDGEVAVFGEYVRHNSEIAVYRISINSNTPTPALDPTGGECGPAIDLAPRR